jgi:hypothetical protein
MTEQRSKYHHFVPRFLLAGFTDDGTRDGWLQVYDRERGKWWPSKIERAGGEKFLNDQDVEAALGHSIEGPGATGRCPARC